MSEPIDPDDITHMTDEEKAAYYERRRALLSAFFDAWFDDAPGQKTDVAGPIVTGELDS